MSVRQASIQFLAFIHLAIKPIATPFKIRTKRVKKEGPGVGAFHPLVFAAASALVAEVVLSPVVLVTAERCRAAELVLLVPAPVLLAGAAAARGLLVAVIVAAAVTLPAAAAPTGVATAARAATASAAAVWPALELPALTAAELLLALADLAHLRVVITLRELIAVALAVANGRRNDGALVSNTPALRQLVHLRALTPAAAAEDCVAEGAARPAEIGALPLAVQLLLGPGGGRLSTMRHRLQTCRDAPHAGTDDAGAVAAVRLLTVTTRLCAVAVLREVAGRP